MKSTLTTINLGLAAKEFCEAEKSVYRTELYGITDGKAIGTFVEHLFKQYLAERYTFEEGNSANGIDLPSINTDIKVTSSNHPQSSCPFKDFKQKIYGLGYNLLLFIYEKIDDNKSKKGRLNFLSCIFIDESRTADFQTTTEIRRIIENDGNSDDIFAFLVDHHFPSDEDTLLVTAEEILNNPPQIGYLTISNALQWRLQYSRVVSLEKRVDGITSIIKYDGGQR